MADGLTDWWFVPAGVTVAGVAEAWVLRRRRRADKNLVEDLRRAGLDVRDIWNLANGRGPYPLAIPVLLDWLAHVGEWVPKGERRHATEWFVRALTVPEARPAAAQPMINLFHKLDDPTGSVRWVVGRALGVVADDRVFDQLEAIVRDRTYGQAREMVVYGLGRSRHVRVVPVLVDLLNDEEVVVQALLALAMLRPRGVREAVTLLVEHPHPAVRHYALDTLEALPT